MPALVLPPECIIMWDQILCACRWRFNRCRKDKEVKARSDNFGLSIRASQIPGNSKDWPLSTMFSGFLQDRRHLFLYLIQIRCRCCGAAFFVCRRCWRGQAYCCDECRIAKKRQNHSEAQRRYRQTAKGKKAHSKAENRRRYGLSKKDQKNMDDTSSTPLPPWCMPILFYLRIVTRYARARFDKSGCCHFCGACGKIVDEFPRRGYGRTILAHQITWRSKGGKTWLKNSQSILKEHASSTAALHSSNIAFCTMVFSQLLPITNCCSMYFWYWWQIAMACPIRVTIRYAHFYASQ